MSDKSLIKNSILLYSRMFTSMIVNFYATRIVLDVLGFEDYGLRNVVAGFASIFTYFNSVLQAGTSRFIALYLGKKDYIKLKRCFGNALIIHIIVAFVILLLAETVGLWFVNNDLNIDVSRYNAANWVYQFATIGCFISVIQTPYVAVTTAHEKFDVYAYLSILDVVLKLLIVYLLFVVPGDKLIIYSFFLLCTNIITFTLYIIISRKMFAECRGSVKIEKDMLKRMLSFSGWTATGNLSVILSNQGINVIMNIFIGTVANAAKGLSDTITWLVKSFASSVLTAITPRLTKLFGDNDIKVFINTMVSTSKLCIFFISVLALPVVLEIKTFMDLWLKETPEYTIQFITIVLLNSVFAYPTTILEQGINAIGKVKKAAIWLSPIFMLYFPMAYIILYFGGSPVAVYYSMFIISILAMGVQLMILKQEINFPCFEYILKIPVTSVVLFAISFVICHYIKIQFEPSLLRLIFVSLLSIVLYSCLYLYIVLSKENRVTFINIIKQKLHIK